MFFAALFLVGFILTAFFSPKPKVENARASTLNDLSFPRADEGDPVPRIYGTVKFQAPNTIWAGDFQAKPIKKKVKTGLFSSKKQTTGYQYFVGLDLAVCLGEGFQFRRMWTGKYELWNGCLTGCENVIEINAPELYGGKEKNGGFVGKISTYCGSYDQNQNDYLKSKIDANVPAYNGIAHIVLEKVWYGNSASIEPFYIEGSLFTNGLGLNGKHIMQNGLDANPVEVLYDLYKNDYGNLGIDPDLINVVQWRVAAEKIWTENNGISLIISNSNTGADLSKEVLRQINGTIFQNPSTGLFELVLLRKGYDISVLPVLDASNIKSLKNFTKKLWEETNNRIRVKYIDRDQAYKDDAMAQADDFANIRFQRRINAADVSFPGVYVGTLANELAARELSNLNVPLYQCEIEMDRTTADLLPGSVFVLNWPEYGIANMVMRIRKFGLGTLQSGTITMSVIQDEFSTDAVVIAPPAANPLPVADYTPQASVGMIIELPAFLDAKTATPSTEDGAHLAVLAKRPGPYSINYDAYADTPADNDDTEDEAESVVDQDDYNVSASLIEAIGEFDGYASAILPTIKIGSVTNAGFLKAATVDALRNGANLILIGVEFLQYEGFADNGDGTFNLTNVHRAMLDTGLAVHEPEATVYFFDGTNGFFDEASPIGIETRTLILDRTSLGLYPITDAIPVVYTPLGRHNQPLAPDYITVEGERVQSEPATGATVTLAWRERNRLTNPLVSKFEDDATEAPEVGTTYEVKVYDADGAFIESFDGITEPTYELTLTADMKPMIEVEVTSHVGDLFSYAPAVARVMTGYKPETLLIDGEPVTIDAEQVEIL